MFAQLRLRAGPVPAAKALCRDGAAVPVDAIQAQGHQVAGDLVHHDLVRGLRLLRDVVGIDLLDAAHGLQRTPRTVAVHELWSEVGSRPEPSPFRDGAVALRAGRWSRRRTGC